MGVFFWLVFVFGFWFDGGDLRFFTAIMNIGEIKAFLSENEISFECVDGNISDIIGFAPLSELKNSAITWIRNIDVFDFSTVENFESLCFVCKKPKDSKKYLPQKFCYIFCDSPDSIYFEIVAHFFAENEYAPSISPTSLVETESIDKSTLFVGCNSHIGKNVKIGKNVVIKDNVSIIGKVEIGDDCVICSNVSIGEPGFGFSKNKSGTTVRIVHLGGVVLGKNVEIGPQCTICRGTLGDVTIGDNTKIDGNTYISHNCKIGKNCEIQAMVVISGSAVLGDGVMVAAGSTIVNYRTIGNNAYVGMASFVKSDIPANSGVIAKSSKVFPDAADTLWKVRVDNIFKH